MIYFVTTNHGYINDRSRTMNWDVYYAKQFITYQDAKEWITENASMFPYEQFGALGIAKRVINFHMPLSERERLLSLLTEEHGNVADAAKALSEMLFTRFWHTLDVHTSHTSTAQECNHTEYIRVKSRNTVYKKCKGCRKRLNK